MQITEGWGMMESTRQELTKFMQESLFQDNMRDEAKRIVDTLIIYKNLYPASKIDDNGLLLYAVALVRDNYSLTEVRLALERLSKTSKFFPALSEIIETIESLERTTTGEGDKDFDEAWSEVYKEVKRCFIYSSPKFSTPEIAETVRNLGWDTLCNMQSDAVSTVRAQFERFYKIALHRKKERESNTWLLHQAGNDAVRLIAERTAAKRSMIADLEKTKLRDGPIPQEDVMLITEQ